MGRQQTFALRGNRTGEILTWNGKVITHTNRAEMEFLIRNATVVPYTVPLTDSIPLSMHPDFDSVQFPLNKEDFR